MMLKAACLAALLLLTSEAHAECDEVHTLALNMYHEARGDGGTVLEQRLSMQMVGEVTLNRVESVDYPDTICGVVYQPNQFHWVGRASTPSELDQWEIAVEIAEDLLNGEADLVNNGATHFFNPDRGTPGWARSFDFVGNFGSHAFYNDNSARVVRYMPAYYYPWDIPV